MKASGERIRQSLHTMLTNAEIDFDMWLAMRNARADSEVRIMLNRKYGRFYVAAENAFLNSVVTILYSVFETRRDTVNFWNLRQTFPNDVDPELIRKIDFEFATVKKIWLRIKTIRNEVVGHQTLYRTIEESHEVAGMTVDDIRQMILACQELLVLVACKFQDTHVIFNLTGAQSFEKLLSDLRSNYAIKGTSV